MTDTSAARTQIETANRASTDIWTALSAADTSLSQCGDHGLGAARMALADALDACDRTRTAIVNAHAHLTGEG